MRPWLLLVSLLVSDLSPLADGDWDMDYFSGKMALRGLEIILTQTEYNWLFFQRDSVYVAVQHGQTELYWKYRVHNDHGHTWSYQDMTGKIHRSHIPALVVSLICGERKLVSAFLVNSNTRPALHVINKAPPAEAVGETSRIAMDIIKDSIDSRSEWSLHHHSTASGHNFQAFLLEKSMSRALSTITRLQKMLTKRYCAATAVVICYCPSDDEINSAMNIKKTLKQEVAPPHTRQKESTQPAMDIKAPMQDDGQRSSKALHDIFRVSALYSGSSPMKTSDVSQLKTQRHAASVMKKNEGSNFEESPSLQRNFQEQLTLKAATNMDHGVYAKKQQLLVSRGNQGSRYIPQDGKDHYFIGKIQAEIQHPEVKRTYMSKNGNCKVSAYILQTHSKHKTDTRDVNNKHVLSDVEEEALIMLFLPDKGIQTESLSELKLVPNSNMKWKTLKELGDPPPIIKAVKFFSTAPDNSKCKCLKGNQCSENMDIKPAEHRDKVATVTSYTDRQVKETTEKTHRTETNNILQENTSINHSKQEENLPPEQSVIPSPPSVNIIQTEETTTEQPAETSTVNAQIKDTTIITEVFNQGRTEKVDGQPSGEESLTTRMNPEPETDTGPRFIKCKTENMQAPTTNPFSGLRMREHIQPWAEIKRKEDEGVKSVSKVLETIPKEAIDNHPKTTGDSVPLCRGLIHRTDTGWKHCMDRLGRTELNKPTDAFQLPKDPIKDHDDSYLNNDDENDHFYYFDGVLKRVEHNFYPDYKRRRQRTHVETESGAPTERKNRDTRENLLSYIRRLTLRNKVSRSQGLNTGDDVQRHTH